MRFSSEALKTHAGTLGFNLVGVTPAAPSPRLDAYFRWLDQNMYGEMVYLAREDRQARRRDLNVILPGVRSIIMVGMNYHTSHLPAAITSDPSRGRIAAYAWGEDYHEIMAPRLEKLAGWLREQSQQQVASRVYVDTGAILERSHAQQAGLGFIGKNTMLINPRQGSHFFLGDLLTDLEFDVYDMPHRETMCGSCTRCQTTCPTNAFPEPYRLDARRCISYLTIEHKGWIDRKLRPLMGNWIMGCDVCQDVCPFSRFAEPTSENAFFPVGLDRAAPPLIDILCLNDEAFKSRFAGSPVMRLKRERLVRNACIAAGNWGGEQAAPALIDLLNDPLPLVRGHAVWALAQIQGERANPLLATTLQDEMDPHVRQEINEAITQAG